MVITKIQLRNYKSIEEANIDLTNKDVIGVLGEYDDNEEESNGAGKSAWLESILFCWFRYSPRGAGDFIGWYADECEASITSVKNEKIYVVKRYLNIKGDHKLILTIDGKQFKGGLKATQEKIHEVLGVSKPTLMTYVNFFTRDSDKILSETPAKRVEILTKDLLNAARYKKYRKEVYKLKSSQEQEVSTVNQEMEKYLADKIAIDTQLESGRDKELANNLTACRAEFKILNDKELEYVKLIEQAANIKVVANQITSFTNQKTIAFNGVELNKKTLNANIAQRNNIAAASTNKDTEILNLHAQLKTLIGQSDLVIESTDQYTQYDTKFKAALESMNKQVSDIEEARMEMMSNVKAWEMKLGGLAHVDKCICPLCDDPLSKEKQDKLIAESQNAISGYTNELRVLDEEQKPLLESRSLVTEKQSTFSTTLMTLKRIILEKAEAEKRLPEFDEQIQTLSETISIGEASVAEIQLQITSLIEKHAKLATINPDTLEAEKVQNHTLIENKQLEVDNIKEELNKFKLLRESLEKMVAENAANESKLTSLKKILKVYNLLYEAFGPGGVQTLLIEEVMKYVEIDANNILSKINPLFSIKVIMEKTNADGEETERTIDFMIHNKIFDKDVPYAEFSNGERIYINFSLRLALSRFLTEQKSPIKFVVLDELVGDLDKVNKMHILKILYTLREYFDQIFFTSHDELTGQLPYIVVKPR